MSLRAVAVLLLLVAAGPVATAQVLMVPGPPAPAQAILTLYVNEAERDELYVYLDGADVLVRSEDLARLGLAITSATRRELGGEVHVSLASIQPSIHFTVDERDLTLRLGVAPSRLPLTRIEVHEAGAPAGLRLGEDLSLFLNYAGHLRDLARYDGYAEAGLGRGAWLLYSSAMLQADAGPARGLSNLTFEDRPRLRRLVLGDAPASGDALGGSALLGGVQLARSFELDPYQGTRPALTQTGVVSVPATAEIYVNGVLVRRQELPPGPFVATDLPATTGAGETRIVVRDALGRAQELASSYYLAAGLLAPRIADYSYTLGLRRGAVGTRSWDYGAPVLLGRHRLGLTPRLTGGVRLEAGPRLLSGGPSASLGLRRGELDLAAALSVAPAGAGAAAAISYGYRGRRLNLGLFARAMSASYTTVSLEAAADRPLLALGGSVGLPVARAVTLNAQASSTTMRDRGHGYQLAMAANVGLTHELQLSLSASHAGGNRQPLQLAGFVGLTMVLGQHTSGSASQSVERAGHQSALEVQRTTSGRAGVGYRLRGEAGTRARGAAEASAEGAHGRASALLGWDGPRVTSTLGLAGALVFIGGRGFATQPVQHGVALLRVPGVAGVRGYLDHQVIGRTDARGDLVVTNVLPYYANRLAIAETDLPMDTTVTVAEQLVATRSRGGAVVRFTARRMRVVRGVVRVEPGRPSPAYGELRVERPPQGAADDAAQVSPIGGDGRFEFETLPPGRQVAYVDLPGGRCTVVLQVPDRAAPIEDLGSLPCTFAPETLR